MTSTLIFWRHRQFVRNVSKSLDSRLLSLKITRTVKWFLVFRNHWWVVRFEFLKILYLDEERSVPSTKLQYKPLIKLLLSKLLCCILYDLVKVGMVPSVYDIWWWFMMNRSSQRHNVRLKLHFIGWYVQNRLFVIVLSSLQRWGNVLAIVQTKNLWNKSNA